MEKTTQTHENILPTSTMLQPWEYNCYAIILFLIGFFGFNFNLIALVLIWKNKLWTPMNIILINLLTSDFCVSFLGTPWTLFAAVYRGWPFGKGFCVAYGFLMAVSGESLRMRFMFSLRESHFISVGISSVSTLSVLAVERFCLVAFPLSRHLTRNAAFLIVISIWFYAILLTVPPLFGWGEYVSEAANIR